MQVVACVKISDSGPSQVFAMDNIDLKPDDFCVVEFEGEEATGIVASIESRCGGCRRDLSPFPSVLRKAGEKETEAWRRLKERERQALVICKEKARTHNLPMSISSARISEKQNKVTFYFTADRRVDFRELVKDLASTLKARIELWQIGVRDEARAMDGYGVCGQRLCCAGWIRDFKAITIRMAKNQDLALSPSKLSGMCGRLMCCIQYEDDQYQAMARELPPVGAAIESLDIKGEVLYRNLLGQWLAVRDGEGNVYQVFKREVVKVLSLPSRNAGAEETPGGPGDEGDDALPDDAEDSRRPSGRDRPSRGGMAAEGAEAYVPRAGVPARPPAALRREDEERKSAEQKGWNAHVSRLEKRSKAGRERDEEVEDETMTAAEDDESPEVEDSEESSAPASVRRAYDVEDQEGQEPAETEEREEGEEGEQREEPAGGTDEESERADTEEPASAASVGAVRPVGPVGPVGPGSQETSRDSEALRHSRRGRRGGRHHHGPEPRPQDQSGAPKPKPHEPSAARPAAAKPGVPGSPGAGPKEPSRRHKFWNNRRKRRPGSKDQGN